MLLCDHASNRAPGLELVTGHNTPRHTNTALPSPDTAELSWAAPVLSQHGRHLYVEKYLERKISNCLVTGKEWQLAIAKQNSASNDQLELFFARKYDRNQIFSGTFLVSNQWEQKISQRLKYISNTVIEWKQSICDAVSYGLKKFFFLWREWWSSFRITLLCSLWIIFEENKFCFFIDIIFYTLQSEVWIINGDLIFTDARFLKR